MSTPEAILKIQKSMAEIGQLYKEDKTQEAFSALVLGEIGAGKTFLLRTARFPMLIDSFDPQGTQGLSDLIESKDVIVDSRYEHEDPLSPTAFALWKKTFDQRLKDGLFNHIGTYVIDSGSMFEQACMNYILNMARRAGQAPDWGKDFAPQMVEVRNNLKKACVLPCDFIITGHLIPDIDKVSEKRYMKFLTTGKNSSYLPMLFSEILVLQAEQKGPDKVERSILTQKNGYFTGRTRMGKDKFLPKEVADIKALLKKAGRDYQDKPSIFK